MSFYKFLITFSVLIATLGSNPPGFGLGESATAVTLDANPAYIQ